MSVFDYRLNRKEQLLRKGEPIDNSVDFSGKTSPDFRNKFIAKMGAEAISELLSQIDLDTLSWDLNHELIKDNSLLRFEGDSIHFIYEEVPKEKTQWH